jgi:hypothetical protein
MNYVFVVDGSFARMGSWLFGYWVQMPEGIPIQAGLQLAPGATP